jgi:hypothetical protein
LLSPETANVILSATYIDEATSLDWVGDLSVVGWWNADFDMDLGDTPLSAGAAFLGSFSSQNVTFNFPDPLTI